MRSLVLLCLLLLGQWIITSPTSAYDAEFCFRVTWVMVLCNKPPMTKSEWKEFRDARPRIASRWKHPPSRRGCNVQGARLKELLTLCHLLYDTMNPTDEPTFPDSYRK